MKSDTVVSREDLQNTGTLEEYNEWRDEYACRIVMNWVIAGVIKNYQLGIKETLPQLELNELTALMMESHELVEEQGLPLVYRLAGVNNPEESG